MAQALSYFGEKGYYLFLPVGDNGRAIDLAVSEDRTNLLRVQCKYTSRQHSSVKKIPYHPIWMVGLQTASRRLEDGRLQNELLYHEGSFDVLCVVTPSGKYLIDWKTLCQGLGRIPLTLQVGENFEKYRV